MSLVQLENNPWFLAGRELLASKTPAPQRKVRIAVLRAYTVESCLPFLRKMMGHCGIEAEFVLGGFNQIFQDVHAQFSFLDQGPWDAVLQLGMLAQESELLSGFLGEQALVDEEAKSIATRWVALGEAAAKRADAPVFLSNFIPAAPLNVAEVLQGGSPAGAVQAVSSLNRALLDALDGTGNVHVLDLMSMCLSHGMRTVFDDRMFHLYRSPFSLNGQLVFSRRVARALATRLLEPRKCIVLDCDNTLWGGIVGEDGLNGILLGDDHPGVHYRNFQKTLLTLRNQGFLLSINTKNNENDVFAVLESHPSQVLKKEHFSAVRANWEDKVLNIRSISEELSLGLNSFIFIDDSDFECEKMTQAHPEIMVMQVPDSPDRILELFGTLVGLDRVILTSEDQARNRQYTQNQERSRSAGSFERIEDFYASLNMFMDFQVDSTKDRARLAQMCGKTNQFNLTTLRHSQADIDRFLESPSHLVYSFSLTDRFGDNGIVGLAIAGIQDTRADLGTFLMSCRVIQRTAERNFLRLILRHLADRGIKTVTARRIATEKNGLTKDFYDTCGFERLPGSDDTSSEYRIRIADADLDLDAWIQIRRNKS